jgi:hypothetical protein
VSSRRKHNAVIFGMLKAFHVVLVCARRPLGKVYKIMFLIQIILMSKYLLMHIFTVDTGIHTYIA